ncbi:hypothetical protein C6401_11075 [Arthrobacter woluwensis]|nr:hypothetical protein C6401_11075 [Arthrobacter woluwensis]
MAKARRGELRLPDMPQRNPRDRWLDGKTIEKPGYTHLIELRAKPMASSFGRPGRLVRLYYMEPATLPDGLYALHLATKNNGPDADKEQDQAISVADRRARSRFSSESGTAKGLDDGNPD